MPHTARWNIIRRYLLIPLAFTLCILGASMPASAQGQVSKADDSLKVKAGSGTGLDKPIAYDARDSIIFDIKNNKVYLYGDAKLDYGDMHLTAYYIEVDLTKKELFAKGGLDSTGYYTFLPVLKDGEDSYKADSMRYNSNSKKGRVYGLRLVQDEAYIHLHTVFKQSDGSFIGERGEITTCNLDHPHFYLQTKKIKVIPNNKVVFRSAHMVLEDVPTPLYVPFGLAPIKKGRRNGIIIPGYGYNQGNNSYYLQNLGYYMGLGERMDLTLNTDIYLNGDYKAQLGTNFIKRYKYRGNMSLAYASIDLTGSERTNPEFKKIPNFSVAGSFALDPKLLPGTSLNGSINLMSSGFNRTTKRDITAANASQINSSITFAKSFINNKVNLNTSLRHSQNTLTRVMQFELPSVNLSVSSLTPFAGKRSNGQHWYEQIRLGYSMNFRNTLNTYDSLLFSENGKNEFKKMRNGFQHNLPISANFKAFKGIVNISPSFNYSETWLFQDSTFTNRNGSLEVLDTASHKGFFRSSNYSFSTAVSTNAYGTYQNLHIGKVMAIRHTLTPTISFNYAPEIDPVKKGWKASYLDTAGERIWYDRFKNMPFSANGQTEMGGIGFGINNNIQGKKNLGRDSMGNLKTEKFSLVDRLNVVSSYNFLADSMKLSDFNFNFGTVLAKKVNISAGALYSPYAVNANKRPIAAYYWDRERKPLRFRNMHMSLNTDITPEMFKRRKKDAAGAVKEDHYNNFNLPWSLGLAYQMGFSSEDKKTGLTLNVMNVQGRVNLTPEWSIKYTTGYDFYNKKITISQIEVNRSLHCWELAFAWVPIGQQKSWVFTLRPKSGVLQDLKLNKRVFSQPGQL